jgi:hypothetical protein
VWVKAELKNLFDDAVKTFFVRVIALIRNKVPKVKMILQRLSILTVTPRIDIVCAKTVPFLLKYNLLLIIPL